MKCVQPSFHLLCSFIYISVKNVSGSDWSSGPRVFAGPRPWIPLRKGGGASKTLPRSPLQLRCLHLYNTCKPALDGSATPDGNSRNDKSSHYSNLSHCARCGLGLVLKAAPTVFHLILAVALCRKIYHCPYYSEQKTGFGTNTVDPRYSWIPYLCNH